MMLLLSKGKSGLFDAEEPKIAPAGLGFIHVSELELKIPKWLNKKPY